MGLPLSTSAGTPSRSKSWRLDNGQMSVRIMHNLTHSHGRNITVARSLPREGIILLLITTAIIWKRDATHALDTLQCITVAPEQNPHITHYRSWVPMTPRVPGDPPFICHHDLHDAICCAHVKRNPVSIIEHLLTTTTMRSSHNTRCEA